jgi:serine protease Do
MPLIRAFRAACLGAAILTAAPAAAQQREPDLGAMLQTAEKYTIKLRATVNWPVPTDSFGTARGTGFIIDKARGWILTNAHVVRRSPALIEIAFGEDDWQPLERLYVDNVLDVAIIRIAHDKLPTDTAEAKLGCDMPLKQGAGVVAYGHPANLAFTATRGIVSSVRMFGHEEYIQLDAQLNPGNSGGPLLSLENAQVLGINTASMAGLPGLGFATPIRHVCPIIELLKAGKDATQPLLPVYWLKSGRNETLTIARAFPNHPAGEALKPGDTVVGIAGERKAADHADLMTALRGRTGAVTLAVTRDNAAIEVPVPIINPQPVMDRRVLTLAGMLIVERNALDIDYRDEPRLRIEFVRQGDEAARRGIQQWDQIETVSGQSFTTLAALHDWLKARPAGERLNLMLRRGAGITSRRVGSEFHRYEIRNADVKLLGMGD